MKRVKIDEIRPKITFYDRIPKQNTKFSEFEDLISRRIKILRILENTNSDLRLDDFKSIEEDICSHFYCRMVCSKLLPTLNWFVSMEVVLMRHRMKYLKESEIEDFFAAYVLKRVEVHEGKILQGARIVAEGVSNKDKPTKIHFTKVIDLVSAHRVNLEEGFCNITIDTKKAAILCFFRDFLSQKMEAMYDNPIFDERIKNLHAKFFVSKRTTESSSINEIANFLPPCIDGLYKQIKAVGHLKYVDRQTLCLFFKDSNVSLEDTISFFKVNFKCSGETFTKEYLYAIRHNYGLEGKRANYSTYTCKKIIMGSEQSSIFGCPFRKGTYKSYTDTHKISDLVDLEDTLKNYNFQGACTLCLSKLINEDVVSHIATPVEFSEKFRSSRKIEDDLETEN